MKRGNRGKNAEQGFTAAIAFVLRERCRLCRHARMTTIPEELLSFHHVYSIMLSEIQEAALKR